MSTTLATGEVLFCSRAWKESLRPLFTLTIYIYEYLHMHTHAYHVWGRNRAFIELFHFSVALNTHYLLLGRVCVCVCVCLFVPVLSSDQQIHANLPTITTVAHGKRFFVFFFCTNTRQIVSSAWPKKNEQLFKIYKAIHRFQNDSC